jgi:hypothetical protein
MTMTIRIAVLGCVLFGSAGVRAPTLHAQTRVGNVRRIAEVFAARREREIRDATPLVRIQRAGGGWSNASPSSQLFLQDQLMLQRYVDVQVEAKGAPYDGVLTFLPELVRESRDPVYSFEAPTRDGVYRMVGGTDADLGIDIQRGALVVQWNHGRLEVLAAGTRIDVLGTRLAISVDSSGDSGWVYLQEGTIIFPDFPGITVGNGEVFRLVRSAPPLRSQPDGVQRGSFEDVVEFNHSQVWSQFRPFYLKPLFYVPALVAGGAVAWMVARPDDDGDPRGRVIIRIPFE